MTRLDLTPAYATDRGLVNPGVFGKGFLRKPAAPEVGDQIFPKIGVMHQRIISANASTHQVVRQKENNAEMHDKTRENIKTLLADAGLSERQLAAECGISQSTLNRFMQGVTESLDFPNLQTIAGYFSLTVSQLIGETPFESDQKVRSVLLAMQQMPEYKKDMIVAATLKLAEPDGTHEPPAAPAKARHR